MAQATEESTTEHQLDRAPAARSRRRGRGRRITLVIVAIAAVAAASAAAIGFGGGSGSPQAASELPPATAQVTRKTLLDTQSVEADLGYGPSTSLTNRLVGTITSVRDSGKVVHRGQWLYKVDNAPVVLMYGSVPAYRTLGSGNRGADVKALERNLKALGYTGFTVDDQYTSGTASAVERWQEDRGLEETGRVELGRVVFTPGRVRVDTVDVDTGASATPNLAVLTLTGTAALVTVRLDVTDQRLARTGAKVEIELPDGQHTAGTIAKVSTVVEAGSGADASPETKIEAIVSLADQSAAAGFDLAAVNVVFTADKRTGVLTVPVAALLALAEGGYGVEVVEGSSSRIVAVHTGLFADGQVEISGPGIIEDMMVGIPK